jgi:hypothetical protein
VAVDDLGAGSPPAPEVHVPLLWANAALNPNVIANAHAAIPVSLVIVLRIENHSQ